MVTIVNNSNKIFVLKLQQGVQAVSLNSYGPLTNNLGMYRQIISHITRQTNTHIFFNLKLQHHHRVLAVTNIHFGIHQVSLYNLYYV